MSRETQALVTAEAIDRAIWRIAEGQHAVVERRQLLAAGVSTWAIDDRIARGELIRLHRGVYLVACPVVPELAPAMAAQLAGGTNAAISYTAAAQIRALELPSHLTDPEGPVDVTVGRAYRSQRSGIRFHFDVIRTSSETTLIGKLRVTTAARTIIDLVPTLEDRELEQMVAHAIRTKRVARRQLEVQIERSRGRVGVGRLRGCLAGPLRLVRSPAEADLLALLAGAGLSPPLTNEVVEGRELDAYWPGERVGIELQSREYHADADALEADAEKASLFGALGYTLLPFTPTQVRDRPQLVIARTRAALERAHRANDTA